MTKWISVSDYAKKTGKKRTNIYQEIVWGRIPKNKWCKMKVEKTQYMIADDFVPKSAKIS